MPSVDSTWVRSAGPPPVNRYTLLKSPSVQIIESSVQVTYSVCIEGQVMKRNFCHQVAPSTSAASNKSWGMARRPVIRISVQNGSDFQMCTPIAMVSATVGSLSQFGPSSPVSLKISVLTTPHSGLNMKRTDRMVGIDGTAQGRMNSTDSHLIQGRCCAKKPDRNSATSILKLMPMTRKISVLTAARAKIGSL